MGHGHQYSPWVWQNHRPRHGSLATWTIDINVVSVDNISSWPPAASQPMGVNMASCIGGKNQGISVAFGSNMGPVWHIDINMPSRGSSGLGL